MNGWEIRGAYRPTDLINSFLTGNFIVVQNLSAVNHILYRQLTVIRIIERDL